MEKGKGKRENEKGKWKKEKGKWKMGWVMSRESFRSV
jgi:hypothetical protein